MRLDGARDLLSRTVNRPFYGPRAGVPEKHRMQVCQGLRDNSHDLHAACPRWVTPGMHNKLAVRPVVVHA